MHRLALFLLNIITLSLKLGYIIQMENEWVKFDSNTCLRMQKYEKKHQRKRISIFFKHELFRKVEVDL